MLVVGELLWMICVGVKGGYFFVVSFIFVGVGGCVG